MLIVVRVSLNFGAEIGMGRGMIYFVETLRTCLGLPMTLLGLKFLCRFESRGRISLAGGVLAGELHKD